MGEPRYNPAGVRDYTGVSLNEIISDIAWLHSQAVELIPRLQGFEEEVKKNGEYLEDPADITRVIHYHLSLFEDYVKDLKRLMDELPKGVEDRHILIIEGIRTSAAHHNGGMIVEFKKDHIIGRLKDERLRHLLDDIYSSIRQYIVDVVAGCSFRDQLATFVGTKSAQSTVNSQVEPLPIPPGTSWSDIQITFIGDNEIYVKVSKKPIGVYSCARCGFIDLRTTKPNLQWELLKILAEHAGELPIKAYSKDGEKIHRPQKQVSLLRGRLTRLFKLHGQPISDYKKKTRSFIAKFQIGIGEASETGVESSEPGSARREDRDSAWDQQTSNLKKVVI